MATTTTDIAMMGIRRRNFVGQTDKYMPYRANPSPVVEAVQKELGFLDIAGVDKAVYSELYRETARERLNEYKQGVRYYKGKHFVLEYDDGEKKPVFNFCELVVDKSVDFFVAKGIEFRAVQGNEAVAEAVDLVLRANDKDNIIRKTALTSSICGDAFWYITVSDTNEKGDKLPKDKWRIVINVIDPFFVFPVFDEKDPTIIKVCMIQFPVSKNAKGDITYKTIYITPDKFQTYEDGNLTQDLANPFGIVPVVHFPNYSDPTKVWGMSDIGSVIPVNDEYNTVGMSIRRIIKYHAEPTTVIFGARASKLEKGAKKVWSGLPAEARVENLEFTADLKATFDYLTLLEEKILRLGGIPRASFQTDQAGTSHTSGLAMRMLYQPLFDKARRKQISFNTSFRRVMVIMQKAFELIGVDLNELADNKEEVLNVTPVYSDPLPFDEVAQLDADIKKQTLGVTSNASLLRKYNPGEDLTRLAIEVIADRVYNLLYAREKQAALSGSVPNPNVALTDSMAVSDDLSALQAELAKLKLPPPPAAPAPAPKSGGSSAAVKPDTSTTVNNDARNL